MKRNSIIAIIAMSMISIVFFSSCNEENVTDASTKANTDTEEASLTPKTLATIELKSGVSVSFKSEEDGIVFEVDGLPDELSFLAAYSMLERFIILTDSSTPVPEDLLLTDDREDLRLEAAQRGTIKQIANTINANVSDNLLQNARVSDWSCTEGNYYDTETSDTFYRTFNGYNWYPSTSVYSSWKSNSNKCKTVNLYLINCSLGYSISARTYYKNINEKYVKQNTISVSALDGKFWSKTYLSKRYRRVIISGNAPSSGDTRFSGYVLFKNYK